jgi:hypothetical protein
MKRPLLVFLLLGPVAVYAQEPQEAAPKAAPGWEMPLPKVQMEMDSTLIPVGKGAVFVPAMTDPAGEPPYVVISDEQVIARTPTGQKTILPPGAYRILVGSGVESQMIAHDIQVYEGHCTLIEPDWAGMVVRVVDRHGMQIRRTYELFALPDGEDFGLGLGADETQGETLRSWLLQPGRYMIVRSGETPRARTDFLTVRLLAGELVYFTLVQNEEDGSFMGGGVVDRGEGKTEFEKWRLGLIVGGDLLWNRMDQVSGREFGNSITINAFVDWSMRYLDPNHLMYVRLQVDEGQTAQPERELQKTIDEVDLDAIYTYRLLPWLGPYVRFGLDTNIFPGWKSYGEKFQDVAILSVSKKIVKIDRRLTKEVRLADSFDPLELKEGVGVSFDLSPDLMLDLRLRLGFGVRHYLVRSLLKDRDHDDNDSVGVCRYQNVDCFEKVDTGNLLGLEATLIASVRLTRWLMIDTELDSLVPFISAETNDPVVNWKNTISLRLVSFASLAYVVKLDYVKHESEFLQAEQRILLRFTFDIL